MNLRPAFLLLALVLAARLPAGTITGTVRAHGAKLASEQGGSDAYASHRYKFVEKLDYDQFRDFVVYLDQPMPGAPFAPPTQPAMIQKY